MPSGIYHGWVHHVRESPRRHEFRYRLGMLMVDLDQWDEVLDRFWFASTDRFNWLSLRRRDHLGLPTEPLGQAVRRWVAEQRGTAPTGSIQLLTQPAYFGYVINPVSFYFCFEGDSSPGSVVAEVNNTPWGEQHCYLLETERQGLDRPEVRKAMHVSPFLPMSMAYGWQMTWAPDRLSIALSCFEGTEKRLQVAMSLERLELTSAHLRAFLARYPFMTWKTFAGIYYQAFRLWRKGVPIFQHPRKQPLSTPEEQRTLA